MPDLLIIFAGLIVSAGMIYLAMSDGGPTLHA